MLMSFKFIPGHGPGAGKQGLRDAYIRACIYLVAITFVDHLLPARIRLDTLYVCCVLLIVGQPIKRIILFSIAACCLILAAHLKMDARPGIPWFSLANAAISIIAAIITSYVANNILKKNRLLEHSVAEGSRNLAELNDTLIKSQSHLRTIFKTTEIAFLLLDRDLRILTHNAIANHWSEESFGTQLQEGAFFPDLLVDERKEPVRNMMHAAMTGDPIHYEACYFLLTGEPEWYNISFNAVKDHWDRTIGLCCSAAKITETKMAEMERARITDDLVQRNNDLEQFSYIVSHNLRAPLANITGLAQILQQADIPSIERSETEDFLFQSVEKLDEVIRDLNHILQVRRDIKEKKETIVLSELLGDILTGFHLVIERENIQVLTDFSEAGELFSIKSYLYSIFLNLVSNSIKYRQPDRPLIVEIKSWIENDRLIIWFKDNGRGIDLSRKINEIFGLYKRFHLDVEGKGMGLFMVKSQVRTLGGAIEIQSQPAVGTAFLIRLPYTQ
jgi:signal transduction histidine kinase